MPSYGQPALVKLLNNALGTYNLAATARMLNLSEHLGIPARRLFEVIGVSTGRSWMSDNFIDVQYDLLLKDAALHSSTRSGGRFHDSRSQGPRIRSTTWNSRAFIT
jgi:3-hydroxyisobutyrate dehydrogenase-like beta-hydroxyacid dehydrogenase